MIAAAVGAERLREVLSELLDRSTAVVKHYGGTLSQFTGDGIMAVFGAPITLEDHAVRACLATLGIQEESKRLAAEVHDRDTIDLRVRVGLSARGVAAGIRIHGPGGVPRRSNADDRRSSGGDPCQAQDGRAGRCAALVTVRHRPGRGDPARGDFDNGLTVGTPWFARFNLGLAGWRQDLENAVAMARGTDPTTVGLYANPCCCGCARYRDLVERYRTMATSLGYEGHLAWAEAIK